MGARLRYAKVIDRQLFFERGGRVQPGLPNQVVMHDEPGVTASFLVLRGWSDDHGTFTERWRIETPGGEVLYESLPRELHLATKDHIERLEDEISDLDIQYTSDDYNVVFTLDENEVARLRFRIQLDGSSRTE